MEAIENSGIRTAVVDDDEWAVLSSVERYLQAGRALKAWYDQAFAADQFGERFDLAQTGNRTGRSFGFFDRTEVSGKSIPVMGNYQEMFYDQPGVMADFGKIHQQEWLAQVREFVCRYFMRVSSFSEPAAHISSGLPGPDAYLGSLSWALPQEPQLEGFGFSQLYYKSRRTGEILKFPDHEKFAIIDLRTVAAEYEWIVMKVRIFDFALRWRLFGRDSPEIVAKLNEASYLVLCPDFVVDQQIAQPPSAAGAESNSRVIGRFGFGYAFIQNPRHGLAAYGPGEFEAAFESIRFEVAANGTITVRMDFVANRPEQVTSVNINPVKWGFQFADALSMGLVSRVLPSLKNALPAFDLGRADPVYAYIAAANTLTGGQAADMMGISREQLDKRFLLQHFTQHNQTLLGSLLTWRQIPNWLNTAALPDWVRTGGLTRGGNGNN